MKNIIKASIFSLSLFGSLTNAEGISSSVPRCTKNICESPQVMKWLPSYCQEAPSDFKKSVDDWGPWVDLGSGQNCWCSCIAPNLSLGVRKNDPL
jgi:hypothetical protein